jgi:DNA polymerase-3 subunit epsilon
MVKDFIKLEIEKELCLLLDIAAKLPAKTGVYYIHNEKGIWFTLKAEI